MGFFSASRTAACESGSGQQCGCTPMACSSISIASQLRVGDGRVESSVMQGKLC